MKGKYWQNRGSRDSYFRSVKYSGLKIYIYLSRQYSFWSILVCLLLSASFSFTCSHKSFVIQKGCLSQIRQLNEIMLPFINLNLGINFHYYGRNYMRHLKQLNMWRERMCVQTLLNKKTQVVRRYKMSLPRVFEKLVKRHSALKPQTEQTSNIVFSFNGE